MGENLKIVVGDSRDDMDLGELTVEESELDTDWEYEEEDIHFDVDPHLATPNDFQDRNFSTSQDFYQDRDGQQMHSLRSLRKTYKRYKKLDFRMILQVILNAHNVFQHETGKYNITLLGFLHDSISALVIINPTIPNNQVPDDTISHLTDTSHYSK